MLKLSINKKKNSILFYCENCKFIVLVYRFTWKFKFKYIFHMHNIKIVFFYIDNKTIINIILLCNVNFFLLFLIIFFLLLEIK